MRSVADLETAIADVDAKTDAAAAADELLKISEEVLEHWIDWDGILPIRRR